MADAGDIGLYYTKDGELWDLTSLVKLTDQVRACLGNGCKLTETQVQGLDTVIERLLDDEKAGHRQGIAFIAKTRFDMLVRDILSPGMQSQELRKFPQTLEMKCFALQRTWRKHFKASIFIPLIDEERQKAMEDISLKNVTLENRTDGRWTVDDAQPESFSHTEGSLDFQPGQWWLNIACCFRDGIVGRMVDDMTLGPYGVTAIPLLSGEEIKSDIADCFIYHRTGRLEDMYLPLMSQLGQTNVRILRGYKLKSPNAPKAGIRYDGLHTAIEYSHRLNQDTDIYEVQIVFKKIWGTPPVKTLMHIPTPSQMDEWKLYLQISEDLATVNRINGARLVPQNEERSSGLLGDPEFIEALKTSSPSEELTKTEVPKKTAEAPRKEREKSSQNSDLSDPMDEGPSPSPISPPPTNKKKLIPRGREERGEFMRSSDFMDILKEGPDAPPPPLGKTSLMAVPIARSKSTRKVSSPIMMPISANKMRSDSGDAVEEPKIIKKRFKPRDPYDIDAMLAECEMEVPR